MLDVNSKTGADGVGPFGPDVIVVSGVPPTSTRPGSPPNGGSPVSGAVSTEKARLAGVGSDAPPALARTWKVCAPSARVAVVCGDEQPTGVASSTQHWK